MASRVAARTASTLAQAGRKLNRYFLLGAGLTTAPLLEWLLRNPDNYVVVGDMDLGNAKRRTGGHERTHAVEIGVDQPGLLDKHVSEAGVVMAMVPAHLQPDVARSCIKHKKHCVTASYLSPEMAELDGAAKEAGVALLNELGVDPGLDHLSAKSVIDDIREKDGEVLSFVSWCGGLPAPNAADNPIGYKFSWNPRGALLSGQRPAVFKHFDRDIPTRVQAEDCLGCAVDVEIYPGFKLEGYPNRDSLKYRGLYEIPEVQEMFRGTLRFKGFAPVMHTLRCLGFYDDDPVPYLQPGTDPLTWRQLTARLLGVEVSTDDKVMSIGVCRRFALNRYSEAAHRILGAFDGFGLFSDEQVPKLGSHLDAFVDRVQNMDSFRYAEHEQDMVVLHNIFLARYPNGDLERITDTIVTYGESAEHTAMARGVGIPVAMSAQLLHDGVITRTGAYRPLTKDVYQPLIKLLHQEGLFLTTVRKKIPRLSSMLPWTPNPFLA